MSLDNILYLCEQFVLCSKIKSSDCLAQIPKEWGVYAFYDTNDKCVYVGKSTGKYGLQNRICKQHLYPGYKESVFRKAIEEHLGINSEDSCKYIKNNFCFSYLSLPRNKRLVFAVESCLIVDLNPLHNK